MTIRIRFRQPAPVARKACKHCENRRALFRQEGVRKWEPYYALCYQCYQRYIIRAQAPFDLAQGGPERSRGTELAPPAAAATAADRPDRTLALETGLMPAR
jgi:hypothetical protein